MSFEHHYNLGGGGCNFGMSIFFGGLDQVVGGGFGYLVGDWDYCKE